MVLKSTGGYLELSKKLRTQILNIFFILAVLIGLIIYMINVDGIDNISYVLRTANYKWILLGLVCLAVDWILDSLVVYIPLKKMYPNHKYLLSFKTNIIGKFFNNITPFSSGGQPFQAYILSKHGLRASDTFSVLMLKFVVYQVSLFSWALIFMLANFTFFNSAFHGHYFLVLLGFFLNLIATLAIFIAGINEKLILKIVNPLIKFGAKIKIGKFCLVKDLDATLNKAQDSISNYSNQFNEMKKQKGTLIKMYIAEMLHFIAYFSIPFMIYKAFDNTGTTYLQILTVQTFLLLIMSFIPTPGSGLGAEWGFALLYKPIFISGLYMAILFWRIYIFYLPIIIGAFMFFLINKKEKYIEMKSEFEKL